MSITPDLRASARGAYRALFRASAATFRGDQRILKAFREKIRSEAQAGRSEINSEAYAARVKLGYEVADVLLKNVVQGVKTERSVSRNGSGEEKQEVWKLRLTKDTELGSNESIKSGSPLLRPCSSQRPGKQEKESRSASTA